MHSKFCDVLFTRIIDSWISNQGVNKAGKFRPAYCSYCVGTKRKVNNYFPIQISMHEIQISMHEIQISMKDNTKGIGYSWRHEKGIRLLIFIY